MPETTKTRVSGWLRLKDEVDYFRMAGNPELTGQPSESQSVIRDLFR